MPEADALEAVLRLVSEGRLTPEEAEPIIDALSRGGVAEPTGVRRDTPDAQAGPMRRLRIETFEGGRRVTNVAVPVGLAASLVPGLSGGHADQIRAALRAGIRGRILEIDEDGDGVVITAE